MIDVCRLRAGHDNLCPGFPHNTIFGVLSQLLILTYAREQDILHYTEYRYITCMMIKCV